MTISTAQLDTVARKLYQRLLDRTKRRPTRDFLRRLATRMLDETESGQRSITPESYNALTDHERELFRLHRQEGLNPVEIAERVHSTRDRVVKELGHVYATIRFSAD